MAHTLLKVLPGNVAGRALAHFKGSFLKEGFTDHSFVAWPKRLQPGNGHKLLNKTAALRDSVRIQEATMKRIVIEAGAGIPYAAIHNTGGVITVTVTQKMRKYFWYMFKQTGHERWKHMAITKKRQVTINIPQRQYIGPSETLLRNIDKAIIADIEKTEKAFARALKK